MTLRTTWAVPASVVVGLAVAALMALGLGSFSTPEPIEVTGIQEPRGLTPLGDGALLIAEVGGGRLLRMAPDGGLEVIADGLPATLGGPQGKYPTGVSSAVRVNGLYYYIVGEFIGQGYSQLYRLRPGEEPESVAGGVSFRLPTTRITNPYDLVPAPGGGVFISDSGVNAVLHVSEDGEISDYAVFPDRANPASDGPAQIDVVPTGLAFGPDDALYVASLTGYPYPQGEAHVYRLEDLNGDGDALDQGERTVFASGFTAATDLAFDEDGSLLVTEFSVDMLRMIRDFSLETAEEAPGRLIRWRDGQTEVVADDLISPTSVAVVDGRTFVSQEFAGVVSEIPGTRSTMLASWLLPVATGAVAILLFLAAVLRRA